ncbi:lipocalin family protein [Chryseobacterium sp. ES2]|uniref:Lipocalin family protein n=1 Tax=Chryseobacterium metallicongregator TaxID=3073042 RepID=A0ABU1E850_9FLAO|nr:MULTISPECIES: lipocalin family protein [Chryseobacterium]MCP1300325.1 lipocalin family protein [Chryseobacterium sp. S0630]MDR4953997.1 lipocalin family protein [Chryseobacterium sp. ES2]
MKKLLLAGMLGTSLFAVSCSSVNKAATSQNQRADFLKMKGDWQIVSIDYDKGYKIKPFDEGADAQCFVGSHWRLIPNNWTGAYTLNGGGDCPAITQPIKFEVKGGNTFMFKKIATGTKAKQNTAGYSLTMINQTTDQFSLEQDVPFEGGNVKVVYNFQRTGMK